MCGLQLSWKPKMIELSFTFLFRLVFSNYSLPNIITIHNIFDYIDLGAPDATWAACLVLWWLWWLWLCCQSA